MKRIITIAVSAALILIASGCGASSESTAAKTGQSSAKTVSDVLSSAAQPTTIADKEAPIATTIAPEDLVYPDLDYKAELDLSTMSSTMIYAEVSNMVQTPKNYLGKTVKTNGTLDIFVDPKTNTYYYSCMVQDATACCASGIEFSTEEEMKYEDFPVIGTPITVGGVFETYKEGDTQYIRLKNAKVAFGSLDASKNK